MSDDQKQFNNDPAAKNPELSSEQLANARAAKEWGDRLVRAMAEGLRATKVDEREPPEQLSPEERARRLAEVAVDRKKDCGTGTISRNESPSDGVSLVLRAAAFAAERHRNQRRKDEEASPYINHPLALACLLANECQVVDPNVLAAALLHDTVEDTGTTFEEVEQNFGEQIAAVVREVTDDKSLPKAARKRMQIEHAAHASRSAKLVKLADKICNLRDLRAFPPADWPIRRKREYFDWAKHVVDQLRGADERLETLFDLEYQKRP